MLFTVRKELKFSVYGKFEVWPLFALQFKRPSLCRRASDRSVDGRSLLPGHTIQKAGIVVLAASSIDVQHYGDMIKSLSGESLH